MTLHRLVLIGRVGQSPGQLLLILAASSLFMQPKPVPDLDADRSRERPRSPSSQNVIASAINHRENPSEPKLQSSFSSQFGSPNYLAVRVVSGF